MAKPSPAGDERSDIEMKAEAAVDSEKQTITTNDELYEGKSKETRSHRLRLNGAVRTVRKSSNHFGWHRLGVPISLTTV